LVMRSRPCRLVLVDTPIPKLCMELGQGGPIIQL
jgi:hypothetical protein